MKITGKLLRKLFILGILCSGVFIVSGSQKVSAADCWGRFMSCLDQCDMVFGMPAEYYENCYGVCNQAYLNCNP